MLTFGYTMGRGLLLLRGLGLLVSVVHEDDIAIRLRRGTTPLAADRTAHGKRAQRHTTTLVQAVTGPPVRV
ncbi:hypothetical protein IDVR_23440 [Intrasporangium sp. DVR]